MTKGHREIIHHKSNIKKMTRGLRNNNPLNIRRSADRWEGTATTQTDQSFVQFKTLAYGYRAAWKTLDTYCLRFRRERRVYNVRNIIARWAPPAENDTDAYVRAVVRLSGLGGNENIPRPHRYRNFERLQRTALLIAAMTCVECGIRWEEVDWNAIWQGYDLAWPGCRALDLGNLPQALPEPTDEDLARAADPLMWDEYRDW